MFLRKGEYDGLVFDYNDGDPSCCWRCKFDRVRAGLQTTEAATDGKGFKKRMRGTTLAQPSAYCWPFVEGKSPMPAPVAKKVVSVPRFPAPLDQALAWDKNPSQN